MNRWILACLIIIGIQQPILAQEADGVAPELVYFAMEPDLVTNYKRKGKRLGFIIVQIQLGTFGESNVEILETHQPLIEDACLELIGAMNHEQVKNVDERERVRKEIEIKLKELLKEETGSEIIEEVLFTKYTYQ